MSESLHGTTLIMKGIEEHSRISYRKDMKETVR